MKKLSILTTAVIMSMASGFSQPTKGTTGALNFKQHTNHKAIKQGLDSVVSQNNKDIFSYDSRGNDILIIGYAWDNATNDWSKSYKFESAYDNNNNQIMIIDYYWDNDWIKSTKVEYTYDNNDNLTMEIVYHWEYNAVNDWGKYYKDEYTYDNNDNRTMFMHYNWENTDWKKSYKEEYTYDNNDNQTMYIRHLWDNAASDWIKSYKLESTYDNNDNRTMSISYTWSFSDWRKSGKSEYTYDNNDNRTMYIFYTWDYDVSDWKKYDKEEYTYDNNNQTMYIKYNWDNAAGDWKKSNKSEYTYDLSYSREELIVSCNSIYDYNSMLTEETRHNWNGTNWVINNNYVYYWSSREITGISEIVTGKTTVEVYPNPATTQLYVKLAEPQTADYSICNLMGQVIASGTLQGDDIINISSLVQGTYFLKIAGATVKFVKM